MGLGVGDHRCELRSDRQSEEERDDPQPDVAAVDTTSAIKEVSASVIEPTSIQPALTSPAIQIAITRPIGETDPERRRHSRWRCWRAVSDLFDIGVDPVGEADLDARRRRRTVQRWSGGHGERRPVLTHMGVVRHASLRRRRRRQQHEANRSGQSRQAERQRATGSRSTQWHGWSGWRGQRARDAKNRCRAFVLRPGDLGRLQRTSVFPETSPTPLPCRDRRRRHHGARSCNCEITTMPSPPTSSCTGPHLMTVAAIEDDHRGRSRTCSRSTTRRNIRLMPPSSVPTGLADATARARQSSGTAEHHETGEVDPHRDVPVSLRSIAADRRVRQ